MSEGASSTPTAETHVDLSLLLARAWALFAQNPVTLAVGACLAFIGGAITLGILAGPLVCSFIRMVRRQANNQSVEWGEIKLGLEQPWQSMAAFGLVTAATVVASLAVVVPGVIVGFFSTFTLWFVALRGHGALTGWRASMGLVSRHVGTVALLTVGVLVLNFLGSLLVVGVAVSLPVSLIVLTLTFDELLGREEEAPQP